MYYCIRLRYRKWNFGGIIMIMSEIPKHARLNFYGGDASHVKGQNVTKFITMILPQKPILFYFLSIFCFVLLEIFHSFQL